MVSGEAILRKLSLMSRFLIPMLQPSNPTTPRRIYRRYESVKKCNYEARIREVKHTTFTPLVFSASGEMADEACAFYKCLASLLCDKWSEAYAAVMGWLRCCLSFSLLQSAIRCVRGPRSSAGSFGQPGLASSVELVGTG